MTSPSCPDCRTAGKKPERIYPGGSTTTLMCGESYYDGDGKFHNHDPNTRSTLYSCSNGHRWSESSRGECWCGWGKPAIAPTPKR